MIWRWSAVITWKESPSFHRFGIKRQPSSRWNGFACGAPRGGSASGIGVAGSAAIGKGETVSGKKWRAAEASAKKTRMAKAWRMGDEFREKSAAAAISLKSDALAWPR